jgi:O-Antigen ligase
MLRTSAVFLFVAFFSVYAFKDWYKSLCALILLTAFVRHESMPQQLMGITGLSPWNVLLFCVLIGFVASGDGRSRTWQIPPVIKRLLYFYAAVILISAIRFLASDRAGVFEFNRVLGGAIVTTDDILIEYIVNPLKWILPGLLMMAGCNSKERLRLSFASIAVFYLVMALLVIRWMPLSVLADADYFQKRAVRVLDREIGIYRVDISMLLAGGFWAMRAAKPLLPRMSSLAFNALLGVIFLGMVLTAGRGGYLAWVVCGFIFAVFKNRSLIIIGPALIAVVFATIPEVRDRVFEGVEESSIERYSQSDGSEIGGTQARTVTAGRNLVWPVAVDLIAESPVLGLGRNGWQNSGASLYVFQTFKEPFTHPHNSYLQLLIDNGLLGSLPILLFYLLIVKQSFFAFRRGKDPVVIAIGGACFAAVTAFLVAGVGGQSFYPVESAVPMWCLMGLMLRHPALAASRKRQVSAHGASALELPVKTSR